MKELGMVYSRDVLGEPGTVERLLLEDDNDSNANESSPQTEGRDKGDRTLEELRFVPGDYLCIAVVLPKSVMNMKTNEEPRAVGAGWKNASAAPPIRGGDGGWAGNLGNASGGGAPGRGGGHWRGASDAPAGRGRGGGRGGGGDGFRGDRDRDRDRGDRDRDRDFGGDRRVPPPRRGSPNSGRRTPPPPPRGGGWGRAGRDRRSRSRSPSRSPARRRR